MIKFFLPILLIISLSACKKDELVIKENNTEHSKIIYENHFENGNDLMDFVGIGQLVSSDLPLTGGDSCIIVNGGCLIPHLQHKIQITESNKIIVKVDSKSKTKSCGLLGISIEGSNDIIYVHLGAEGWVSHVSENHLDVKEGDILVITINSGGLKSCPSWIDNLVIESL